jgi:hypothetical protein
MSTTPPPRKTATKTTTARSRATTDDPATTDEAEPIATTIDGSAGGDIGSGYVWVSRTVTTVDDPDDDRAPGYVHIPGQEEPRLVDAKSVPELEVLGYRVVDAPKNEDADNDAKKA